MYVPRYIGTKAIVVAALAALVGCGGAGAVEPTHDESFWGPIRISGDEVEGYTTLADMARSADVVAVGQATDFGISRKIATDAPEDVVTYGFILFSPAEVLYGTAPDPIPIEFIINVHPDDVDATAAEQIRSVPNGDLIVFLREKRGSGEEGLYRLVNSYGLWTELDGDLTAPAAEDPTEAYERYKTELAAVDSLDDLARAVS